METKSEDKLLQTSRAFIKENIDEIRKIAEDLVEKDKYNYNLGDDWIGITRLLDTEGTIASITDESEECLADINIWFDAYSDEIKACVYPVQMNKGGYLETNTGEWTELF